MANVRTRFAPSPTGFLHIGSLRTALFAYLAAKSLGGECILRIEDTDRSRQVKGSIKNLIKMLDWVGITFDEGPHVGGNYGPYTQSERREIYDKYAKKLLEQGSAYRCFCSPERLKKMREVQQAKKLPPRYDNTCRNLSDKEINKKIKAGEDFVIRQKMPESGEVKIYDELRGEIIFKAKDLVDQVLIKSDGMPTYQFAVVVDDHKMAITHVLRGDEWIPSFPKNILLYQAFGWSPPKFYHLPLILNKGGGKLSKRQGDVTVEDYKTNGYLPEALINFSVLLGWHPKGDEEHFILKDLEKIFNIEDIGISPAVFDLEKFDYFNGYYIRQMKIDELIKLCLPFLKDNIKLTTAKHKKQDDYLRKAIRIERERIKKLSEIGELTKFLFLDKLDYEAEMLVWKKMEKNTVIENLNIIITLIKKIPEENWTDDSIEDSILTYLKAKELKIGEYLWPMRVSLSGQKASPGPFEIAEVLGKTETTERIKAGVEKLK